MGKSIVRDRILTPTQQKDIHVGFFMPYDVYERFVRALRLNGTNQKTVLNDLTEEWLIKVEGK